MLRFLAVLAIAIVAGLVVGFMLGGLAATAAFGPKDDEYHTGLFQMGGAAIGALVTTAIVIARKRKR